MQQCLIPPDILKAPNVSTVPQYSPFRYPGGKTWLYPFAKNWLTEYPDRILIEPFAGGGYVSLVAAIEGLVEKVIMVELDENVASVWKTILGKDTDWLINNILKIDLTHESVDAVISNTARSTRDRGFATLLTNRIVRGGILAPGSGRIKNGENGKGIKSRWYPETLVKRINKIASVKDRITFIEGDGLKIINDYKKSKEAIFFVDPPYPKAGRRLYTHFEMDHYNLVKKVINVKGNFLLTYEDSKKIRTLAEKFKLKHESILMSTTHHRKKFELLLSKDVSWVR